MNLLVPIILFAAIMGLFVKRMTPLHWGVLVFWISLNIAYFYVKH